MKKALKKQAALVMLSAAVVAQTGFPGYAAATVTGSWKNEDGAWKFYGPEQQSYTGWVKTESGWYYLNPEDGKMVTGWQKIDGHWYYFDTAAEGTEGKMHTGWYKTPENNWFFFHNGSGTAQEGHMATGWQWIDGYCYYFSAEPSDQPGVQGAMYAGRQTPDGYPTNADGQWTQDGKAVNRPGVGFNTKTSSEAGTSTSGGGSSSSGGSSSGGSSSGGSSSGGSSNGGNSSNNGNGSNSGDNSNDKPDTPDTPDKPDTPDTPDAPEEYQYLLMNIPYDDFYAAEIEGNDADVDAVTSATKSKPRSGSLVAGSYHVNSDGSDISGVTFPVKIKKGTDLSKFRQITDDDSLTITVTNRGQTQTTTYEGKDALFESTDYAYYVLSEAPSYYKEVSVDEDGSFSFGKAQGTEKNVDGVSAALSTNSSYGDYQLGFNGMPDISTDTVYGVVLHTTEGEDYGLRHLENIWLRTQLAWSAGFTTQSHSSPLSYEHYKDMMGKHLSGVTYYTSEGILEVPFTEDVYVPVKIAASLNMENAAVDGGETGIAVTGAEFPSDYDVEYQVKNALGETVEMQYDAESGKLTWNGRLAAGSYTLTVTDKSGKYAPVSGTFTLETEAVPAAFTLTEDGWKVTKAEDASDEEYKAYLAAITKVKVGDKEYAASGRGAVKIIDAMTGEIDFTAKSNNQEIFTVGEQYTLEITAAGYKKNLVGTVVAAEKKPETNALEGEATVETTDGKYVDGSYQAKVLVTVDADGKIVSIKDNGTDSGANNRTFWNNATGMFARLAGKTVDEIDAVDAITNATVSSNAIKQAVKNALKKSDVTDEYQYLLMNIPYAEFYEAEINGNNADVDAVTSATKSKPRSGSLVAGSYHVNSDGSDISGVTFPVKIKKGTDLSKFRQITDDDSLTITVTNRGQVQTTTYEGKDALFESTDYAYYVLSEAPSYYKEVSVDEDGSFSFGKAQGTEKNVDGVSAALSTNSSYGDYQLGFNGMPDISTDTVYGVVLHTTEGEDYGLRHLENIWLRTQLAWSAGFTTQSHSSPLSYEHYKDMMGKHLSGVTYYTSEGILEVPFTDSVYVPVKIAASLSMENAAVDGGETGIVVTGAEFPSDYDVEYQVKNALGENVEMKYDAESGKLTWEGRLTAGSYTLTVTDKSGKYAPVSGIFTLETEAVPAAFTLTEDGWKVTKAEDASDEEYKAYLAAITKVKVGDKEYAASGRGAVKIIDAMTGEIDFTAKSNNQEIFTVGEQYTLEITAAGYKKNLVGTVVAAQKKPETNALEGEATVETTDGKYVDGSYQAKVLVTVDADGKIVSIKDNGTDSGANSTFWDSAMGMFVKLAGKTADEVDSVDEVTGATVSSNAIKKAVKSALKKNEASDEYQYLLMNIPYAEFYEAEVEGNEYPVDGVSSATKMKTRTGSLVGGSYHTDPEGTNIKGVIYPVRVAKGTDLSKFRRITDSDSVSITVTNRGKENTTEYKGKEALFQSDDYSYYVLSEMPDYYKELTIDEDGSLSFGEVQAEKESIASGVSANLQTETNYGDYQLSFKGIPSAVSDAAEVYGVVLHTEQGEDYGLRHLENIWLKTNLAWSAGIVTTTHGNTLAPQHYESMMGKTITGLTYYTSNGVMEITLDGELYVPYKFNYAEFGVAGASASAGKTEMTGLDAIPSDFEAEYTFTDPNGKTVDGFTVDNGTITWSGTMAAGTYTVSVKDKAGKYAEISASFILSTAELPAQAAADSEGVWSLKAAEDASEEAFAAYLSSITSVSVNGKAYAASGRGAVQIIDPNTGIINTDAKSGDNAIFVKGEKYEIEVTATGYEKNLTFEMIAGEAPQPEGIEVEGTVSQATTGFYVSGSYQAKLKVAVNADGTVASVTDNGTEPGANATWWNNAVTIFKSLIGKNKNQIDAVDAVSTATASSGVIKNAVKSVLPDLSDAKPQIPKLTAEDSRTKLLYAATETAELAVEAEEGSVVKYTLDGSDPSADGSSVKTVEDGMITVEADANADAVITVKAVAVKNGVASEVAEKELQFIEIPEAQSGLKVYEGSATVNTPSGAPYTAKLKVTVSDGKIVKVEDNGTKTSDIRDEAFWGPYLFSKDEEGISDKFAGKDLADMLNAKTVPNSSSDLRVDAITGATVSSDAAKYAVIDALRSEPVNESDDKVMAPEVSAAWGSLVTRVSNGIRLEVSAAENTKVYYTTDGSDPTQEDETPLYGATIYADNNKAGKVKVKFAAFDENGNRSKIVSVWCVFTDELPEVLYKTGTYEGSAGNVEATVTVERGYGSRPIISNIELDEDSENEYANFLPELIAEITYQQSTKIKPLAGYDADMQQQVLDAVEAALEDALSGEVMVSMNPEKKIYGDYYGTYEFEEAPEVTLSCSMKNAEIYYYVTNDLTTENPDVDTWTLYDGAFTPEFTKEKGGSVYVQIASTRDGGETWMDTRQISISYKEKANENAVMIGDTGYTSLSKALAAVEEGDEIVLNEDASLEGTIAMPEVSFSITSADGECYKVESKKPLELNGNLEISNVDWLAETYLNGHDFTAGEGIAQSEWRFSYTKLYAGSKKDSVEADPTINISSGQFEIYGCARDAELNGDVSISVDGTAMVKIIGAASGSELNGNIDVTVNGEDGAMLASFIGRQSSAKVSGDLTLRLEGAVQLTAWGGSYQAIEYSTDTWGTLDLTDSDLSEEDADRFIGFETILGGTEEEAAEEIAAEEVKKAELEEELKKDEEISADDDILDEDEVSDDQKSDESKDEASDDEKSDESKDEVSDDEKSDEGKDEVSDDEKSEESEDEVSDDEKSDEIEDEVSDDEKSDESEDEVSEDEKSNEREDEVSEDEKSDENEGSDEKISDEQEESTEA